MLDHSLGVKDWMDEIMERLDLVAFDVRIIVIHGMGDIMNLQKKLLFDILKVSYTNLSFVDEGAHLIKRRFHGKKILIVLDDIDNQDQILRLAGDPNWYGGGSRIIITTRNIEFLVNEGEDDKMNWDDALQLFCERALGCAKPPPNYVEILEKVINALGRLPLALNVVGSTLRGKCKSTWENVLYKLKKVMNEDKTIAIKYWDVVFGYPTEIEVKILTRMSLIKIIDYDELWMHDQLRDLRRDIVHLESCNIRLRGSRLWLPKDAFHLVQRKKEFARLVNLRFLQLDHGNFQGDFKDHFPQIRWLSWSNCPSKFLATNFGLENLAVLELSRKNITKDWGGWHQIMLKVLKLLDCPSFRKTPKFSTISNLERLILRCNQLRKTDKSIGFLQHLDYLEIFSQELSVLPHSIGNLVNVKHLILSCWELQKLPDSIGQLESLLELDVRHTSLKVLNLGHSRISELPRTIGMLENLEELSASCEHLEGEIPSEIGALSSLKILDLSGRCFSGLPTTIKQLTNLQKLNLWDCRSIQQLPELPKSLRSLSFSLELLTTNPDFSNLTNLVHFYIIGTTVPEPNIEGLLRASALRKLTLWLQQLSISYADPQSLTRLPSSLQELTLVDVQAPIDWSLFSNLENFSRLIIERYLLGEIRFDGFGKLRNFNELMMFDFPLLKILPVLPCQKEIQHLYLRQFPHLTEIQESNLSNLQNLKRLDFNQCESLESVLGVPKSCELTASYCPRFKKDG
ncbi:hypothetical protein BT93_F1531 [Corymbia citriodora subsp. variegata]|nr:hypothetical protein BT93_F1531 [Corymbia citriodora subsp. variegata]